MSKMRKINTGVVSFGVHARHPVVSLVRAALTSERREVEPEVKTHPVPKVGDTVVLNDEGLEQVYGRKAGLNHMKTLRMKITHVDAESLTFPEPTYPVEVDNPEINIFLIDHNCFDIVERA